MYRSKKKNLVSIMIFCLSVIVFQSGWALADGGESAFAPIKSDGQALLDKEQIAMPKMKAGKRWYVDSLIFPAGDGTSWSKAFRTIAQALTAADDYDQIWVKNGTYSLTTQLLITEKVRLYGGFVGTERRLSQRRRRNYDTVIDGGGSTRAMFINDIARVDGFIFENCTSLTEWPVDYDAFGQVPVFIGAAMLIRSADPRIIDCEFVDNFLHYGEWMEWKGQQGIVYIDNGAPIFRSCLFKNNKIDSHYGAGAAVFSWNSSPEFIKCRFINNTINYPSTGASGGRGGAMCNVDSFPVINQSYFRANKSHGGEDYGGKGAAIYNENSPATITRTWFLHNATYGEDSHGGAIYNWLSDAIIENCGFHRNKCNGYWDDFDDGKPVGAGGAIYNRESHASIINCTLYKNIVLDEENHGHDENAFGGGIYNESSNPVIVNSILWANRTIISDHDGSGDIVDRYSQIYDDAGSNSTVSHCDIDQGGYFGEGNIRRNPLLGTALHLTAGSPCRDLADSSVAPPIDIDGEKRFVGDKSTDIGFDEFIDSDGDGMPDWWEKHYRLDLKKDDSKKDPDRDKLTNLREYIKGTNPRRHNKIVPRF